MKTVFALSALVAVLSLEQASAMRTYLQKLPNGDKAFTQELGHVSATSYDPNPFGELYSKNGGDWAKLCKEPFPGADMTVGEAFGDPCCKWTGSGKPEFEVEPFTKPTKKTECAANKPAATSAAPAATTAAPAATTAAPAATTAAPAGKPADTPTVTPAPAGKATPAPAGKPDTGKPDAAKPDAGKPAGKPSKCGVKKDEKKESKDDKKQSKKESKSLEDETDDDDEVFDYSD